MEGQGGNITQTKLKRDAFSNALVFQVGSSPNIVTWRRPCCNRIFTITKVAIQSTIGLALHAVNDWAFRDESWGHCVSQWMSFREEIAPSRFSIAARIVKTTRDCLGNSGLKAICGRASDHHACRTENRGDKNSKKSKSLCRLRGSVSLDCHPSTLTAFGATTINALVARGFPADSPQLPNGNPMAAWTNDLPFSRLALHALCPRRGKDERKEPLCQRHDVSSARFVDRN
jgi:hypothetical protein